MIAHGASQHVASRQTSALTSCQMHCPWYRAFCGFWHLESPACPIAQSLFSPLSNPRDPAAHTDKCLWTCKAGSAVTQHAPNMPLIWWPYSSFICTLGLVASQQEYAPCTTPTVPDLSATFSAHADCATSQPQSLHKPTVQTCQPLRGCWPHNRRALQCSTCRVPPRHLPPLQLAFGSSRLWDPPACTGSSARSRCRSKQPCGHGPQCSLRPCQPPAPCP